DPDPAALARNQAPKLIGTAEDTGSESAAFDLVTVAQAWHWFDEAAAAAEIARILTPGGRLLILINQLDVRIEWVLRLSRIMHVGDDYRPHDRTRTDASLRLTDHSIVEFTTALDVDSIDELARTRSYWIQADERTRDRVESNQREYFRDEHPV